MLNIALVGSTGSIGVQTLDIVRRNPDKFKILALTAHSNQKLLAEQVAEFKPRFVGVTAPLSYQPLTDACKGIELVLGEKALTDAVRVEGVDLPFISTVGVSGLTAVFEALKHGKTVALANKEALVVGGNLVVDLIKAHGGKIIPVDSEHSAIFQCLAAGRAEDLKRIVLTCSGGAFRDLTLDELRQARASDALKHPNWSMGNKITIDCATLMNKGLETIEARYLFDFENIEAVLHRQSIIHSMVEFKDNSVIAQMSYPSMELPIKYALTYPSRLESALKPLDFSTLGTLTFEKLDTKRFPCYELCMAVLNDNGAATILNAANEVAVSLYLKDLIGFYDIPDLIKRALDGVKYSKPRTVDDLLHIDRQTREYTLLCRQSGG